MTPEMIAAFQAARERSRESFEETVEAINRRFAQVLGQADKDFAAAGGRGAAAAERDRAYARCGDTRDVYLRTAEGQHQDRLAALAAHFGQAYRSPGQAAEQHAEDFVSEIDPHNLYSAEIVISTIGEVTTINHNGVNQTRRVHNGRVCDGPDMSNGWSNRGTFSGDAEAFATAKRAVAAV
jgi:hypothetical protein